MGSTRSPLWRHGGVVFGPHPRDFSYVLPDKIKAVALKSTLNSKVKENNLIVLDALKLEKIKTKEAIKIFFNLKICKAKEKKIPSVLLLLDKLTRDSTLSLRNVDFLKINLAANTQAYEVMAHKKLVITKDALNKLIDRLK